MEPIASPQVSDPIYDRLELGQLDLQELLGDSLVEAQHLKELQGLEQRRVTVLQEQSLCAATHADTLCADVTLTSTQTAQVTQRELAGKCCELAAACIDINRWKKQAALQQLRLVSVQEDLTHQKVYAEALSAECSRRQELNDNLQAQLQIQHQHSAKLDEQIAEAAAKSSDLQKCMDSMQQTLKEKESLLVAMETKLQEVQRALEKAVASAGQQSLSAQRRHDAVEERARLAEQVAAAARERANIAEQRLEQRLELAQHRDQHALDLLQERHEAAAARAAASEQRLKEEVGSLQRALQRAQFSRPAVSDGGTKEVYDKLEQITAELASKQQQLKQRDAHIAKLEESCRHQHESSIPLKKAAMAAKKAGPSAAEFDVGKTAQTQAAQADAVPSADAHQAQQVSFRPTTAGAAGAIDPPSRAVLGKAVVTTQGSGKDTVSTSQQAMIHQGNVAAVTAQGAGGNLPSTSQQSGAEEAAGRPGSRPTRQRSRAQPYWMTGAAGNSPAGNSPSGQSPAAKRSPAVRKASTSPSDSAAASATETVAVNKAAAPAAAVSNRNVSAATPPSGQKAGAAKGKRAVAAKRQAKASPNKDGAQQPPVKRSKAAQQAEAAQSVSGLPAEAEFAAQPAQDQSTSAQQAQAEVTGAAGKAAAAAPPADAIAGALQKFGLRQPTRPVGVAKIDLASSFTQASASPASSSAAPASGTAATSRPQGALAGKTAATAKFGMQDKPGVNKENETEQGLLGKPETQKPLVQRPKALNDRVVAAAAERRTDKGSEPQATKPSGQVGAANKRRILKPINVDYNATDKHQDILPANMLFGDAFMVPKLRK